MGIGICFIVQSCRLWGVFLGWSTVTPEAEVLKRSFCGPKLKMLFGSNQLLNLTIQLLLEIVLIMAWKMFTSIVVLLVVNFAEITSKSLGLRLLR